MGEKIRGSLVAIGGNENRSADSKVLQALVREAGGKDAHIVVCGVASEEPQEAAENYLEPLTKIGAAQVDVLTIKDGGRQMRRQDLDLVRQASCLLFTGGDQLRITSLLGGTELARLLHEVNEEGLVIAGTSAGAAVMSDVMIIGGQGRGPARPSSVRMAPGLGFLREVVVDQHFAQRGRIGRLLSVVAHNPFILGLGIDEDTAILMDDSGCFRVVGSGQATVIDGSSIQHSNVAETEIDRTLALVDVKIHLLSDGYGFDMARRRPLLPSTTTERDGASKEGSLIL